jgi:hypothetical protein
MSTYRVRFTVPAEVVATVEADDSDEAADIAWAKAQDYLATIRPDAHGTALFADLDGIGADEAEEVR